MKSAGGPGKMALFVGGSGSGKTLAAQVLANTIGYDLYRVDSGRVTSKYIGETEKNLSQVFASARSTKTILFFDEADAIFGKRTDVKDSHDRYSNGSTSHLLQKIEAFHGLTILSTNQRSALAEKFARRFRYVVTFPYHRPDP